MFEKFWIHYYYCNFPCVSPCRRLQTLSAGYDGVQEWNNHCDDVIMGAMVSQITSLTIVYSIIYSGADQRKHQSSASLAFVRGIHRGPVNSPHKWPVTRKMFPFDDVIMTRIPQALHTCCWEARWEATDAQQISDCPDQIYAVQMNSSCPKYM